jgi:hypothetical protein
MFRIGKETSTARKDAETQRKIAKKTNEERGGEAR